LHASKTAARRPPASLADVLREESNAVRSDQPPTAFTDGLDEAAKLRQIRTHAHADPKGTSALCLSGGGIRSATFSLGALQAMARFNILGHFDYLSTVSGGGFAGGWLTAWIHHASIDALNNLGGKATRSTFTTDPCVRGAALTLGELGQSGTEADPIRHLRDFSNYLSPRMGVLSGDTWTLAATVLRNLFLNWLLLAPILMLIQIPPRLVLSLFNFSFQRSYQPPHWVAFGMLGAAVLLSMIAVRHIGLNLPSGTNQGGGARAFLWRCFVPWTASCFLFTLYRAWIIDLGLSWLLFVVLGMAFFTAGWLFYLLVGLLPKDKREFLRLVRAIPILKVGASGAAAGLLLYLMVIVPFPSPTDDVVAYTVFAVPGLILAMAVGGGIFTGLASTDLEDDDREWLARAGSWSIVFALGWVVVGGLVFYGPALLFKAIQDDGAARLLPALGWTAGLAVALIGLSSRTGREQNRRRGEPSPGTARQILTVLASWATRIAVAFFLITLLVSTSALVNLLLTSLPFGLTDDFHNHRAILQRSPRNFCAPWPWG